IAEQGALDAIRAGHQRQFGGGDRRAAIVVRMHGQDHRPALRDVAAEPLEHIGVSVGRRHLDGGGQVEDEAPLARRLDDVLHRLADSQRHFELGAGEALGRIFEDPFRLRRLGRQRLDLARRFDGDLLDAVDAGAKHHVALQGRGRVVEMQHDALGALDRLEGALNQFRAALRQHLDGDIVGHLAAVDDGAHEIEIGLRGGGEGDLDLLEAHADEQVEHAVLALDAHRLDERLVAVAQIDGAPDRRVIDDVRGPLAVGQRDRLERLVFLNRHGGHAGALKTTRPGLRVWREYQDKVARSNRRVPALQSAGRLSRRIEACSRIRSRYTKIGRSTMAAYSRAANPDLAGDGGGAKLVRNAIRRTQDEMTPKASLAAAVAFSLVACAAPAQTAPAPANTLRALFAQLNRCMAGVRLTKGTDVTVQF